MAGGGVSGAASMALGLRLAGRELRGGFGAGGFRIFLACLALGVAAIAGVGSLSEAVTAGLAAQGRALLGGDVELRLSMRPASADERAYLDASARLSEVVAMHAMARPDVVGAGGGGAGRPTFVHLKAVDGAYPLFGAALLEPPLTLAAALGMRGGVPGAVAEATLIRRLGLAIGDRLRVGEATFELRAVLAREPDRVAGGIGFGPRLMIAAGQIAATGLVREGSLVRYHYRVALDPGIDRAAWVEALRADRPAAGWRVRDASDPQPTVKRFVDRLAIFLTLVGLATLLVGGLGVGGAVRAYLEGRTATIATLKSLGATGGLVFRVYLAEVLALSALGIVLGLCLGALAPLAAAGLVEGRLPGVAAFGLYPGPLARAAAFGLLTGLCFALWPLARAREVPAAHLFRDIVAPEARWPRPRYVATVAVAAALLAGLVVASIEVRSIALWFVAAALTALLLLRAAADAVKWAARSVPRPRAPWLRLALGNLHRPGAPTADTLLALGLGLSLVVAVGLVEGNFARHIEARIAGEAPAFYFIDIQPDQVAAFEAAVRGVAGAGRLERVPHLRGRISRIKGVPVEEVAVDPSAAWVVSSDRGITYAARPPPGARIVAGEWWPEDYAGPPLISLDAHVAEGLGVGVGDSLTINVLGRDVEGRIASLRAIDWGTLGINFVIVFAPGVLEAAPQTHIATVQVPRAGEDAVFAAVTERLPNVSGIAVREVLDQVARLLGDIATGARAASAVTLVASALVVGGAVAAGQRRRVYDAVVLKVLGATRADIAAAYLVEFGVLGLVSGLAAAALGTAGSYLVVARLMRTDWQFVPGVAAATIALCLALALVIGFAGTWQALGRKALPVLRHD